jgi:DNA-binding transcriptional ArsR family regulator
LLDVAFSAPAGPALLATLARLASGDNSVAERSAPVAMSQPAISRHLEVPEQDCLVTCGRDTQQGTIVTGQRGPESPISG